MWCPCNHSITDHNIIWITMWVPYVTKKFIVPVEYHHHHGTTNQWGTLLRGRVCHHCALSSMAVTVVCSWSGFYGFHPWISGFCMGCCGPAGWVGCRDGGSGEGRVACPVIACAISRPPLRAMCAMSSCLTHWGLNKWPPLCAIFLDILPDCKFQIELTNENCCSFASYYESCSNWKKYHWFG